MRIRYDHGQLRLDVADGEPLHAQALDTWREADALAKTCIATLAPSKADTTCGQLAETATHALTAGRDARVIADFQTVERELRDADENARMMTFSNALVIFFYCLAAGLAAGIVWILIDPYAPWNVLPRGLALAANYTLLLLGWTGFTLVGFSIGWLFLKAAVVRIDGREGIAKHASSLRQHKAHIAYNVLVCLIIVIVLFFFGGFTKINNELSEQLTSAPWAILLGLVAGVAEPALFERLRGFLRLS